MSMRKHFQTWSVWSHHIKRGWMMNIWNNSLGWDTSIPNQILVTSLKLTDSFTNLSFSALFVRFRYVCTWWTIWLLMPPPLITFFVDKCVGCLSCLCIQCIVLNKIVIRFVYRGIQMRLQTVSPGKYIFLNCK